MRSKPAFELDKTTLKGRAETEWHPLAGKWWWYAEGTYGDSFGEKKNLGYRLTFGTGTDGVANESMGASWMEAEPFPKATPGASNDGVSAAPLLVLERQNVERFYKEEEGWSANGTVDYKVSNWLSVYYRFNYGDWDALSLERNLILDYYQEIESAEGEVGHNIIAADSKGATFENSLVRREMKGWEGYWKGWTNAVGGYIDTDWFTADFRIAEDVEDYFEPDYFVINFIRDDVDLGYNLKKESDFPRFFAAPTSPGSPPLAVPGTMDAEGFVLEDLLSEVWSTETNNLTAVTNIVIPAGYSGWEGYFKLGAKFRAREFDQFAGTDIYEPSAPANALRMAEVLDTYREDTLLQGRYQHGLFSGLYQSRDALKNQPERFELNVKRTREASDPSTYNATEDVTAGYFMGSFETGKTRILAGVRAEHTALSYRANEVIIEGNRYIATNQLEDENDYLEVFPSIHARYKLNPKLTIIGSWTKTIKRPQYSQLAPYRNVNLEDRELWEGNPDLDPIVYDNYDLAFDWKPVEGAFVSIELYYRTLDNFFYSKESVMTGGPYDGFTRYRDENSPGGNLSGVKVTWNQQLDQFADWLKGVSFNLQYSWQKSEIEYPNRPGYILPFTETPANNLQAALTIERGKWYGQVVFDYADLWRKSIGDNPVNDMFTDSEYEVDLTINYQLNKHWRLYAEWNNLSNSPEWRDYQYDNRYTAYYRHGSWKMELGVRYQL